MLELLAEERVLKSFCADGLNHETRSTSQFSLMAPLIKIEKQGQDTLYTEAAKTLSGCVPLGHTAQIYDAEIIGAVAGLPTACSHFMARFATNLALCLDNEEAAAAGIEAGTVQVRCIPGHQGIPANELADKLAKEAYDLETCDLGASVARDSSPAEDRYRQALASYWELNSPKRYKDLHIGVSPRLPPELLFS
ncbi:hypothetical protein K3495_g10562 [Podosphaera aphanis]|nr:hypothetical protein K3495_g10562 [Podosphaera aphanis]